MKPWIATLVFVAVLYAATCGNGDEEGVGHVALRKFDNGGRSHKEKARLVRNYKFWQKYKKAYDKEYGEEEEWTRFWTFYRNLQYIMAHNKKQKKVHHNFTLFPNHLADYTDKEYHNLNGYMGGLSDSMNRKKGSTFLAPNHVKVPHAVDWREHGYVTKVKNQGKCGSCWSFSTTGSLEGQNFRKTGKLVSLSEQNLVDCSTREGNHGCNGGLMDFAFEYIKENDGIDTEQSYPYEARESRCRYSRANRGADDTGWIDVARGNESALKIAIGLNGPVSVAIDASHRSFMLYEEGVYYEADCSSERLDHGVLVVGYGTSDEGLDYWIVKNSWGPHWGQHGYVRMARNRDNNCGIASAASYPLV